MKNVAYYLFILCFISCSLQQAGKNTYSFNPPPTNRISVTDTYYGMEVTDYYRWMEDLNDTAVMAWFKAQGNYTNSWLDKIPGRDSLLAAFMRLDAMKPAEITALIRKGNRYFFKKTFPEDKTGKLYYRDGKGGEDVLLYYPGKDEDGTPYSISAFKPSDDGKKVALLLTKGGTEISHLRVLNVNTGELYEEDIFPCRYLVSWSPDNKGFLYLLMSTADVHSLTSTQGTRTMYHLLGTDVSADKEVFSRRKYSNLGIRPRDICWAFFSEDGQYIIGMRYTVSPNITCVYAPASELSKSMIHWKPLLKEKDNVQELVIAGKDVYMKTSNDASNFKIVKSNLDHFSVADAETVIPEKTSHITQLDGSEDFLFITYSDGINSTAKTYNIHTGQLVPVEFPMPGEGFLSPFDIYSNDGMLVLTSWTQPVRRYTFDADSRKIAESAFDIKSDYPGIEDLKVVETEIPGHDGTMIPLSIIYNKNVKLDGSANCLLRGYGSYGLSFSPYFDIITLGLLNRGVIFAVAHVRGGGEKGEDWYKAGYKTTKPNTWKDFISCAKYLVKHKYTSPGKLIGMGTSAGGITIGRAITTRPDLFGAAICNVGVGNALRGENTPGGPVNVPEFGTVKDSVESRALYEMDAVQHVVKGANYPAVIGVCGMNDPRVMPWQTGKLIATLQYATASGKPVFLQVNYDNGHFTEDKAVTYKNFANMFAFSLWQTGHAGFQLNE